MQRVGLEVRQPRAPRCDLDCSPSQVLASKAHYLCAGDFPPRLIPHATCQRPGPVKSRLWSLSTLSFCSRPALVPKQLQFPKAIFLKSSPMIEQLSIVHPFVCLIAVRACRRVCMCFQKVQSRLRLPIVCVVHIRRAMSGSSLGCNHNCAGCCSLGTQQRRGTAGLPGGRLCIIICSISVGFGFHYLL